MDLRALQEHAVQDIQNASTPAELEAVRVRYIGRRGEVTSILRSLKELSLEERKIQGKEANNAKEAIKLLLAERLAAIEQEHSRGRRVDITKPGILQQHGHLHPLTRLEREVKDIFTSLNFSVVEGPEMETEHYNFDALNIPGDHPARDMWDTFWLKESGKQRGKGSASLLRTHTSPMQIRYMETHTPPFQIIVPGRVFRYEATDASHEVNFYQVEGLMVGPDVTLAHLKYVLETFLKKLLGDAITLRFRPSYFPFVEPGLEVDVKLGPGHPQSGSWLELLGAGMVHPHVFSAAHYNPDDLQGFAFGIGLDRLAIIKYNIPDIRLFYSGDLRFIHQF